jgi:hypothetical protein
MQRDEPTMPINPIHQNTPDPAADIPLFLSSRFSAYSFRKITSGTDIYAKISPDKPVSYYLLHWSVRNRAQVHGEEEKNSKEFFEMLDNEQYECVPISEECTIRLLRGLSVMPDTLRGMKFANILHHLPGYFNVRRIERSEIREREERDSVLRNKERSLDVVYIAEDDECGRYVEYFRQIPEST